MTEYHKKSSQILCQQTFKATRSETPMDNVTLWIYCNVSGKMKNYHFKNADGIVREEDGLQIGLVLERTALNHNVFST